MELINNLPISTDSYKNNHWAVIHKGLTEQYTYAEGRVGGMFPNSCFLGLDPIIIQNFMNRVPKGDVSAARDHFVSVHGFDGFDFKTWNKVSDEGYLPIEIKALPEGTVVGLGNPFYCTRSTKQWFAKTQNSLETLMMHFWYPTTETTREMEMKIQLIPIVKESGSMENLPYMVVDFGARGTTWKDSAVMGGIGHLVHFQASDNNFAGFALKNLYNYTGRQKSIIATEHSVALSYGPGQGEFDYVNAVLDYADKFPGVPCAIVIDTYNAFNFVKNVIGSKQISDRIKERTGRVILRPDSGDPQVVIEKLLELLVPIFGYTLNDKDYKVINHNVGLIQGDGMTPITIPELYRSIHKNRWSCDNLAVGSGGGILQVDINRDIQRIAIKPSKGIINGEEIFFKKNPFTDPTKGSKEGELKTVRNYDDTFTTVSSALSTPAMFGSYVDAMLPLFKDGEYLGNGINDFNKVIERAESYTNKFL